MKTKLVLLLLCILSMNAYSQNITNTLGVGGVFKITENLKGTASDFLTVSQSTGEVNVLRTLRLENTTGPSVGVIFTGTDRFIHNYGLANTFIGINSGNFTMTGLYNTAIGSQSLNSNTTGDNNSSTGYQSLYNNNKGSNNTANGIRSLYSNTTGTSNTASGAYSLYSNTIGFNNTANGVNSLVSNTTGNYNTASGSGALYSNTMGDNNTATGYSVLVHNTIGFNNTANGVQSLYNNTTGNYNTAVGINSLFDNTTGNSNTGIGYNAYPTVTTTNYTGIGYNVGSGSSTSDRVEIGNTSVGWIGGQVGWSIYSDERIKDNITENVPGLAFINKLRPVTYNLNIHKQNDMIYKGKENQEEWDSKYDIEKIRMTGFIAQEVEKAATEANYNFSGVEKSKDENGIYSLRYSEFVVPLVKAVQEQQVTIQSQQKTIEDLTKRLEALERK